MTGSRVVLLVGAGNNGGDALFAGAYLARRGAVVTAVCISPRVHADGLAALRAAHGRVIDVADGAAAPGWNRALVAAIGADVLLDGLVGIGSSGALHSVAAALVEDLTSALAQQQTERQAQRPGPRPWVIAVDVPSGIGVDDGAVRGPVLPADRTVTFGAAKPGLLLAPAAHLCGELTVVDIGLDFGGAPAFTSRTRPAPIPVVRRLEPADVAELWAVPGAADHKYTRGVLGVVAGTSTFPGAAVLVVTAAVRTGPGLVRFRGPQPVAGAVIAARPEAIPAGGQVQAWALGSGIPPQGSDADDGGQHQRIQAALSQARGEFAADVVGHRVPAVVDAGALSLLTEPAPPWVVLTPHAGELCALLRHRDEDVMRADIEAEPLRWARRAHELTGATVLLKGAVTTVVGPGVAYAQTGAPAWLATAGSGDVLAGILGSMLAAHAEQVVARPALAARVAAAAVLVHSLAGERANPGGPVAALDVANAVPGVIADLLAGQ